MIRSSRMVKMLAVSTAAALHGVVIWGFTSDTDLEIEGSAGAVEASIGTSFADMAAGTISASETTEVVEEIKPEEIHEPPPQDVVEPTPAEVITAAEPPTLTETPAPEVTQAALEPTPSPALPAPAEVIEPEPEQTASVNRSVRPKTRSADLEKRAEPPKKVTEAKPKPKKKQAQPRGNAKQNATKGSETGKTNKPAKVAGTGKSGKQQTGNAATSNYPGKVMKKIARVPKPRVGSRGTSVVAFTISSGGGLSAISLARSSGSPKLDQAALRVVQRAAPFPPPPAGARRSFSIKIKGG